VTAVTVSGYRHRARLLAGAGGRWGTVKPAGPPADSSGVTTLQHAPDWKVTAGYRVMLALGWASLTMALGVAAAALMLGLASGWWVAGVLALVALGTTTFLPEPVPVDMIIGGRNHVGPR